MGVPDHSILVSVLAPPCFGKLPFGSLALRVNGLGSKFRNRVQDLHKQGEPKDRNQYYTDAKNGTPTSGGKKQLSGYFSFCVWGLGVGGAGGSGSRVSEVRV